MAYTGVRAEYYKTLESARRQYAQLKRYVPETRVPDFEDIYKPISGKRGYSERNVRALEKRMAQAYKVFERLQPTEEEEEYSEMAFNNLKYAVRQCLNYNFKYTKSKIIVQMGVDMVVRVLEDGLKKFKFYTNVMVRLRDWASDYVDRIQKIILFMYSDDYKLSSGNMDLAKYRHDVSQLVGLLGMPFPIEVSSILTTLDTTTKGGNE